MYGAYHYVFVNSVEIHKFKGKGSKINVSPLCLGSVSKDFSIDNMKEIWIYGYAYDFSVDDDIIDVDDILDILKYIMKKLDTK